MTYWRKRDSSGSSPAAAASNLHVMAQIEELRREMRQQQKQEIIVHNMPPAPTNPIKEIIREIHQVHVPQPAPQSQPQSEDTARLIAALSQAVAQNQNLVGLAQRMGLSMDQLVALLRAQLKRPEEAMVSSPPGPPPPPPREAMGWSKQPRRGQRCTRSDLLGGMRLDRHRKRRRGAWTSLP